MTERKPSFLTSRFAPLITHLSLAAVTSGLFAMLLLGNPVLVLVPCLLLTYRIGILLHEYIHGIPFRRTRYNLAVLTLFEGVMLTFGILELFRRTHLAHHRWLNTEKDPDRNRETDTKAAGRGGLRGVLEDLKVPQHLSYLRDALRRTDNAQRPRLLAGMALSFLACVFWVLIGKWWMVPTLLGLTIYNAMIPSSLRGAIEHYAPPEDPGFANEYRSILPAFNINRHIHHHLDPGCPWYLLEFRTPRPLPAWCFLLYWPRVYLQRRYTLMRPMKR